MATTWRRVAGFHLGWDVVIMPDFVPSFICLFLAKLTCASATALRAGKMHRNLAQFLGDMHRTNALSNCTEI